MHAIWATFSIWRKSQNHLGQDLVSINKLCNQEKISSREKFQLRCSYVLGRPSFPQFRQCPIERVFFWDSFPNKSSELKCKHMYKGGWRSRGPSNLKMCQLFLMCFTEGRCSAKFLKKTPQLWWMSIQMHFKGGHSRGRGSSTRLISSVVRY